MLNCTCSPKLIVKWTFEDCHTFLSKVLNSGNEKIDWVDFKLKHPEFNENNNYLATKASELRKKIKKTLEVATSSTTLQGAGRVVELPLSKSTASDGMNIEEINAANNLLVEKNWGLIAKLLKQTRGK